MDESHLREIYNAADQGHVFAYYETLNAADRTSFLQQLASIAVANVCDLFRLSTTTTAESDATTASSSTDATSIQPFVGSNVGSYSDLVLSKRCSEIGLQAIGRGEVAALVLAGGQGTRLGFDGPKGMYDIGLPSHKSLFQLIVERLIKLKKLASSAVGESYEECSLPFYIMTSPINHEATKTFFSEHNFFGYGQDNVVFFMQGMLPCFTPEGKFIMETPSKVAMAPDGNGGIYPSLKTSGALDDMNHRGVKYLHVFSIDNALAKPADPIFLGFCIEKKAECGNKSTWKSHAHEKVGVVALRDNRPCVVEYSEISHEMAERTDDATGRLVFGAGNICNHFYTMEFLRDKVLPQMNNLFHVANKKIPYYNDEDKATVTPGTNNGIKLETFIFDVFPLVEQQRFAVWEVQRSEEFAPVKNAPGSSSDSPDTARAMITNLSKEWLRAAGAQISPDGDNNNTNNNACEISPLLSYAGEDLEHYSGQTIQGPFHLVPPA
ncbi:hypothetical protein ACA910_017783 [Epithemia clementina (nom. ined.)]